MFLFKSNSKQEQDGTPCHFGYSFPHNDNLYACFFKNQSTISNHIEQLKILHPHSSQKTNNSVEKVEFINCNLTKIPIGLKKLFPNFHTLIIGSSNIEAISKKDLEEYKDLKKLSIASSKVQYLHGDLFNDFQKIEEIQFYCQDIKLVDPNIFNGLNNLKKVVFYCSLHYSIFYEINENNTLENLKTILYDKIIIEHKPLLEIHDSEKKLKKQVDELQKSQIILNQQLSQLRIDSKKDIEQQKQASNLLEEEIVNLETKIENKRVENKQLRTFGERQKQDANNFKTENAKINRELQNLKAEKTKLTQQVEKLRKSEAKLTSENNQLKNSKSKIEKQLEQVTSSEKQLKIQVEELKEINKNLTDKNQQLEKMKETLAYDLTCYTQNESTKDFKIIIGDKEFPVHKYLIIARSPTLAEILKNNPEVENLNLVDISVEIFEKIFKFLYTDELPGDDGTNFLHLFTAAGKLKILKLVEHAAIKLNDNVDCDNALTILPLSVNFKLHELKHKAFEVLKNKYSDVKFEEDWLENPEKLIKVVTMLKKKEEIMKKFEEEFLEVTKIL